MKAGRRLSLLVYLPQQLVGPATLALLAGLGSVFFLLVKPPVRRA